MIERFREKNEVRNLAIGLLHYSCLPVVGGVEEVLENEKLREETAKKNYELALQHYSYEVLERDLLNLLYQLSQQTFT